MNQTELIRELEALVADHPLYHEAHSQPYCVGTEVVFLDYEQTNRFNGDPKIKNNLMNAVKKPAKKVLGTKIRVLSILTAEEKPEFLTGSGQHYAFYFHPDKPILLHADKGTWRS